MDNVLINFEDLDWDHPQKGVSQKVYTKGNQQLRLLRFDDSFREEDWCTKGHLGYVLDGEMKIVFKDKSIEYTKGDGLWIAHGKEEMHCVSIEPGNYVELILFENIELKK